MKDEEADRLERVVGRVLRVGWMTSTSILAVGLALALLVPGFTPATTVIRVGLIVLLLTPVSRVVASVVEYTIDRDWLFAALTFMVLAIILASMLVAVET